MKKVNKHKIMNHNYNKYLSFHTWVKALGCYILGAFKESRSKWSIVFAKWTQPVWPRITL